MKSFSQQLVTLWLLCLTICSGLVFTLDYQEVYTSIAQIVKDKNYDYGSYGPIFLRLAWHASGTYDKNTGTGGSNGATMRFDTEAGYSANVGLKIARDRLEIIKKQYPDISYSDLWSLAGVVGVQELGGPIVSWRAGRVDANISATPPDGRLPSASKGPDHLRDIFYRMGFDDQEIVVLSGAHCLGRAHRNLSGYSGPWTLSPIVFTNGYYIELLINKWTVQQWNGPTQYTEKTGKLMMLPTDLALSQDDAFHPWVDIYARDNSRWFKDFAETFKKLQELGVPFKGDEKVYNFTPTYK